METPEKSYTIELGQNNIHDIEFFVDYICDQLQINETYSGNILVALSELFNLMNGIYSEGKCVISYSTDYQRIIIKIRSADHQIGTFLNEQIELSNIDNSSLNTSVYLVHSLVDNIEITDDNEVSFLFDISALHNKVFSHRKSLLTDYFENSSQKLIKK